MDSIVYEDTPGYDVWLKTIMLLPVFFVIMGIYDLFAAEIEAATSMLAATPLMGAIYWAIFPRKYLILDSKIKIVLGRPFSFNIPFNNLETARAIEGATFGINFPTCFSSERAVSIIRKKGRNVNITPSDRDLFLENLNKALTEWRRYNTAR
jgi:hypothetical protein